MSVETQEELSDWSDLIASRGWAMFVRHIRKELDTEYPATIAALIEQGGDLAAIRQLTAIRKYVLEDLLRMPYLRIETLERLENKTTVPPGHRRGKAV